MTIWPIESVSTGALGPLGPDGLSSGIAKQGRAGVVALSKLGLQGDAQGDRKHHGGPDKAVHHYPRDHYRAWRSELGDHALLAGSAAFGENIATFGVTEAEVAIGDKFRLGSAIVEISQGRLPCYRVDLRFERRGTALRMQETGRTGWYYRVLEAGDVAPGDNLIRLDRVAPEWTLERIRRILFVDMLDLGDLRALAGLALLPESWRRIAEQRLITGQVEDWTPRLAGA
ncbi:MOSC domain-containing protein [Sphingosinicella sp. BN140058]|uniref:MOSC domain-containing protein n=1 Tax=Sphingosinicella sp. BN140058 TaxID=1892855 RepID=UPI00101033D6|nr:MOSC domain-containing protein [Sphingosinicella sp. BN140058]QAY76206.1 MOSC domain-containing protein [Sphingosinicella sp. BN140058]